MAQDTPDIYRNLVLYSVYIRNHGPSGTFADVTADLPRIQSMGVDLVWLLPIHPIGLLNRKGSLGSPYSIQDFRGINPEYGGREDFAQLLNRAHELGLKVIIDVVYNHTAHDALLIQQHPEWYHLDELGHPVTTNPEWADIIDLSYSDPGLSDYLVDSLKMWAEMGVDGFRCDVASVVPVAFWERARREVANVRPGAIWLAESVHPSYVEARRRQGLVAHSDAEIYAAFDITYDYDIWSAWEAVVNGDRPVADYLGMLRWQDAIYPTNYIKLRAVENHDQPRIMRRARNRAQALAWTAFQAFNKGSFFIYGGQESENKHTPSLFETDKVSWQDYPLQPWLTRLAKLKKHPAQLRGLFTLLAAEPVILANWQAANSGLYGLFNVSGNSGLLKTHLPDGNYEDVLTDQQVTVSAGQLSIPESAAILRYTGTIQQHPVYAELLDYRWSGSHE